MKTKNLFVALVATVGVTLTPGLARAAEPNVPVSYGDLVLGFQLSGDNDLLVDIGPYTQYVNATSAFNVTFGLVPADQSGAGSTVTNLANDLTTVFGAGWASNTGSSLLQWGVAGKNGVTNIFLTQDALNATIPQDPGNSVATTYASTVQSLYNGLGGDPSTVNSTKAASVLSSAANSWTSFSPGSNAFGSGLDTEQIAGSDGPTDSTLTLLELVNNGTRGGDGQPATDIGSFTLNGAGDLTFTPAAVPEPSTWVSIIVGVLSLGFFRRRGLRAS
jgi:hypothetical protein